MAPTLGTALHNGAPEEHHNGALGSSSQDACTPGSTPHASPAAAAVAAAREVEEAPAAAGLAAEVEEVSAVADSQQLSSRQLRLNAIGWYLCYFASQVTIFPFLAPFFKSRGLDEQQWGLINTFRPWISAPCAFLWSAVADRTSSHRAVMLGCFATSVAVRCCLLLAGSFGGYMALVLITQVLAAPVGIMADAAVVAACTQDGDYGIFRKWGAVGWGGMSFLAGVAIDRFGMGAAFLLHAVFALPCLLLGWNLQRLKQSAAQHTDHHPQRHQQHLEEAEDNEQQQRQRRQKQHRWRRHHAAAGGAGVPLASDADASCTAESLGSEQQQLHSGAVGHPELELVTVEPGGNVYGNAYGINGGSNGSSAIGLHHRHPSASADDLHLGSSSELAPHAVYGNHHHAAALAEETDEQEMQLQRQPLLPHHHHEPAAGAAGVAAAAAAAAPRHDAGAAAGGDQGAWTADDDIETAADEPLVGHPHDLGLTFTAKLLLLVTTPDILIFFATATLMGFGFGVIESFLFMFLQVLGGTDTLMGLSLTITCAAEVPAFQWQGALLDKIGIDRMLDVVLLTYCLRLLAYSMLPRWGSPWAVLPVEVLHGITFACGWGAGTVLCKRLAPPGLEATMQGTLEALWFGLGYGMGALWGGLISKHVDFPELFALAAVIVAIGWAAIAAARAWVHRRRQQHQRPPAAARPAAAASGGAAAVAARYSKLSSDGDTNVDAGRWS